jgi:hypothetical protein
MWNLIKFELSKPDDQKLVKKAYFRLSNLNMND